MYKALYRKWRPLTFEDVVSQPHITATLKNQVMSEKTAHAYLFTGSRGTGKTTCARILAKAVNCLHSHDGNPCLECDICREADEGTLVDIIEIDAASNNGVDDIRELRDGAAFTPQQCRYKVYIIDEVHMLSIQAFNALLKIIEEPPEYVKFILATTEIHKVPVTILSRCQRFDFHRIRTEDIIERISYIASQEGITLDADAAALIAGIADGGMRDALSLVDRCTALSDNITAEVVSEAVGIADRTVLFDIIEGILAHDAGRVMELSDGLYARSKDMLRLCDELIYQFRNLMLLKSTGSTSLLINIVPSELERMKKLASATDLAQIMRCIELLRDCGERLVRSPSKRVELEMCFIKLCTASYAVSNAPAQTVQSVAQVRAASTVREPAPVASAPAAKPLDNSENYDKISKSEQAAESTPAAEASDTTPSQGEGGYRQLGSWPEIMERFAQVCPAVSGVLAGSCAYENGSVLMIDTPNSFFISLLKRKENAVLLSGAIKDVTGKAYKLRAKCSSAEEPASKAGALMSRAAENGVPTEMQ